ncbi:MAG: hypothetical protein H6734_16625 [Alphaproteobacteria bacterium]|nr:hypothetical protein [Alphaproteobacteria bacterium]
MTEAFTIMSIFLGMASVIAVPLAVLLGLPLIAWNMRAMIRLKERELDLRRLETAARIRETRALPYYVDSQDPAAVLAWASASRELANH